MNMQGRRILVLWMMVGVNVMTALLLGCAPVGPEEARIEETLREYFRNRGYLVKELRIEAVERNPLPDREYMGPLTFVVKISSLTLETTARRAGGKAAHPTGAPLAFTNATIQLRRGSSPERPWEVARISGIDIL